MHGGHHRWVLDYLSLVSSSQRVGSGLTAWRHPTREAAYARLRMKSKFMDGTGGRIPRRRRMAFLKGSTMWRPASAPEVLGSWLQQLLDVQCSSATIFYMQVSRRSKCTAGRCVGLPSCCVPCLHSATARPELCRCTGHNWKQSMGQPSPAALHGKTTARAARALLCGLTRFSLLVPCPFVQEPYVERISALRLVAGWLAGWLAGWAWGGIAKAPSIPQWID